MSQVLLKDFLAQQQNHNLTENLVQVILTIASTCQDIDAALQKGALAGILGSAKNENVQGETQKKLDVISNKRMVNIWYCLIHLMVQVTSTLICASVRFFQF